MLTNVADTRINPIVAELVVLGWADQLPEDCIALSSALTRYVANAVAQGFTPREILDDVLEKYGSFFGPIGEIDRVDHADRTVFTFILRARRGR